MVRLENSLLHVLLNLTQLRYCTLKLLIVILLLATVKSQTSRILNLGYLIIFRSNWVYSSYMKGPEIQLLESENKYSHALPKNEKKLLEKEYKIQPFSKYLLQSPTSVHAMIFCVFHSPVLILLITHANRSF